MKISATSSLVCLHIRFKCPLVKLILNCGNMSNKNQDAIRLRGNRLFSILFPKTCHLFRKYDKLTFNKSSSYFSDQSIYLYDFQYLGNNLPHSNKLLPLKVNFNSNIKNRVHALISQFSNLKQYQDKAQGYEYFNINLTISKKLNKLIGSNKASQFLMYAFKQSHFFPTHNISHLPFELKKI